MAYISQDRKKELTPAIKAVLKKYDVKASISVDNHSTLVVTIASSGIDFLKGTDRDHISVNTYWIEDHFTGRTKDCLLELKAAMMTGNHDNSDIMTDYFDVGWYIDIKIGKWNKPYIYTGGIEFA
jgi:hypothetical protein